MLPKDATEGALGSLIVGIFTRTRKLVSIVSSANAHERIHPRNARDRHRARESQHLADGNSQAWETSISFVDMFNRQATALVSTKEQATQMRDCQDRLMLRLPQLDATGKQRIAELNVRLKNYMN